MSNKSVFIRLVFLCLVIVSIAVTYYLKVIVKDYDVVSNDDGLPILEE